MKLTSARARLAALVLLTALGAPLQAATHAIHKCTGADGKTWFSDAPCPDSGESAAAAEAPARPAPAPRPAPPPPKPAKAPVAYAPEAAPKDPHDCSDWAPPDENVVVEPPRRSDPNSPLVTKRSASTVAAACSSMVSACTHRSDDPGKAIDGCFKSAPRCKSDKPWEEDSACCPQTCFDKYAELRRHCVEPSTASYRALFLEHCVAGAGAPAPQSPSP